MITWCHAMRWPNAPNWQNISSERCKYNNKYANCDMLVHHYYIFDWANSLSSFVLCILSQKIALSKFDRNSIKRSTTKMRFANTKFWTQKKIQFPTWLHQFVSSWLSWLQCTILSLSSKTGAGSTNKYARCVWGAQLPQQKLTCASRSWAMRNEICSPIILIIVHPLFARPTSISKTRPSWRIVSRH